MTIKKIFCRPAHTSPVLFTAFYSSTFFTALVAVCLSVVVWPGIALADVNHAYTFSEPEGGLAEGALRRSDAQGDVWHIELNDSLTQLSTGDQLQLPLPNGESVLVTIDSQQIASNGDTQLTGDFDGGVFGITIGEKVAYGSITGPELNYSISITEPTAGGLFQQILADNNSIPSGSVNLEQDFRIPPENKGDLSVLSSQALKSLEARAAAASSQTQIDIMVVYSREFGQANVSPRTRINELISFTNAAFTRSGIMIKLRLARAQQINFNNGANIGSNLDAATNASGAFSQLPQLRNQYGADMIAVLHSGTGGASGVAWIGNGRANFAVSSTRLSTRCCNSVFAHELGHNLGSGHEHRSSNPNQGSPCGFNWTGYACGHGDRSHPDRWGTIMSYLNDSAIGFQFSNLDRDCLGFACGIREGQPNPADNRRSFNISRLVIQNYRKSVLPPPPPPPPSEVGWMSALFDLIME